MPVHFYQPPKHPNIYILEYTGHITEAELLDSGRQLMSILNKAKEKIHTVLLWRAENRPISAKVIVESAKINLHSKYGKLVIVNSDSYLRVWAQALQAISNSRFLYTRSKEEAIKLITQNEEKK